MRLVRVVMLSPVIGDAFGQERVMRDSAKWLRAHGAEVHFVGDKQAGRLPEGEGSRLVPGLSSLHNLSPRAEVERCHRAVLDYLAKIGADLVHLIDQFDARLERALCEKYPTILSAHTVAPTCPASTRATQTGTVCERQSGWGCLVGHHRHGCLSFLKTDLHRAHAIYNYRARREGLSTAKAVIAISRYIQDLLIRDGWPADKVHLVYNPVPIPKKPARASGLPENLLLCAARLVPMKGIDRLLRALSQLREEKWTLWLCGEGPQRGALERLRDELGLGERVIFKGRVAYDEMPSLLVGARALVQPNLGPEGFGLAVAEASALGTPVVATKVPALDEIVSHGETGLLARPGDSDDLAAQLRRALTDETFVERCRERGPKRMAELFSLEAHGRATWAVYEKALALNTSPRASRSPARAK